MPAALPEEVKTKVKLVALQLGIREAARQFEIPEATVQAWSAREGWMKQKAEIQQVTERSIEKRGLQPVSTIDPSHVLLKLGNKSKLRAAKLGDRTLQVIQRKALDTDGEALIPLAPVLKTTVDTLDKVHSWSSNSTQSLTQVNINLSGPSFQDSPK